MRRFFVALAGDEKLLATFVDFVARNVVQRRRGDRFTGAQIETRVVPRASHDAIDHYTLGQRPAVMGASRADGKKLVAPPGDQNRLAKGVAQQHFANGHLVVLTSPLEIRTFQFPPRLCHTLSSGYSTLESRGKALLRVPTPFT